MFREMRRKRQLLDKQESMDILVRGTAGVLALLGDNGYPYALPISYACDGSKLYFHGARVYAAQAGNEADPQHRDGL